MKAAFLPDRGVVKVSGDDARDFLNGLLTTDAALLRPGLGRFGALLTPQGKIIVDFLITEAPSGHGGGFLMDCPRALAQALADKLGFYKLRAKVAVENLSDSLGVLAAWDGDFAIKPDLAFADPRSATLGWRILVPAEFAQKIADLIGADLVDSAAYDAHRIASGVPRGGLDFMYGDAFPHETNMDRLHGVDFEKGCYVGQEGCRECNTAAPRAPEPFGLFSKTFRRKRVLPFSPATSRWAPWVRRQVITVSR